MIDETTFAGDEASAINQRLREYRTNKKMLDELDKSENAELKEVRNFYDYKRKKINEDNDLLLTELLGFIDYEHGQTSVTTSMGNVQARTTKDSWKWGGKANQRKAMKVLPDSLIKTVTTTELDKAKIKEATTITDDGKVILNETGEIVDGLSGVKGGKKQAVVRLDRKGD